MAQRYSKGSFRESGLILKFDENPAQIKHIKIVNLQKFQFLTFLKNTLFNNISRFLKKQPESGPLRLDFNLLSKINILLNPDFHKIANNQT